MESTNQGLQKALKGNTSKLEDDKWEEECSCECKCNLSVFGKECSCECAESVIIQGTLGKSRRVISGKGHLKSVVAEGAIPQFAHG